MTREQLAQELEKARLAKQSAEPRSDAWYDADARVERITKLLYAGRTIDLDVDSEVESE